MKDSIEYLAIVVIAVTAGYWLLSQIGWPLRVILDSTARIITGGV